MATLNNLFRKLLNVNTAVFSNMRIETDQDGVTSVIVMARVKRKESHRCPVCGRKCPDMTREAGRCVAGGPLTCAAFFSS